MDHQEQKSGLPLSTFDMMIDGRHCRIRIFQADLTATSDSYDIVACSAFKGGYNPSRGTLIGALSANKGISVANLAGNPDINMRPLGCWLSTEIPGPFHRIACLELLEWKPPEFRSRLDIQNINVSTLLKSTFLTLRHLLETAAESGILIRNIAMPVLGAGHQGIDTEYIAAPLFNQCLNMFRMIESLNTIDFYELNPSRAVKLNTIIQSMLPQTSITPPSIFISYSSKQISRAHALSDTLTKNGFSVWIAPEGIPAGSSYLAEIPAAISNITSMVLMLTEDAMHSPWVQREASSAIGAGKEVIPAQLSPFTLSPDFHFLLESVQILKVWSYDEPTQDTLILNRLKASQK